MKRLQGSKYLVDLFIIKLHFSQKHSSHPLHLQPFHTRKFPIPQDTNPPQRHILPFS